MKKLLIIIVLFFSTSVFAQGKWLDMPFSFTDLLKEGWQIIDQYSTDYHRQYLLKSDNQRIVLCRYQLDVPSRTDCYVEANE
jgi:hypothetical protein